MADTYKLLAGYRHVTGVPMCPCADPGNYMSIEQSESNPLALLFRCWCGSTLKAEMESQEELTEFLTKNGVTV